MKILLAYDGSEGSKSAVEDLAFAGLPKEGVEVRIVSIAEFIFPADSIFFVDARLPLATFTSERLRDMSTYVLEAAESAAEEGRKRLNELFPEWKIETWARLSSPASTILEIANDWKPDLIVMGSHGRSALGRFFIGSVSMRIANEAHSSVRIVKRKPQKDIPTILLAFDGSIGARTAVNALVQRSWQEHTKLHIVTVADASLLDYLLLNGSELLEFQKEGETQLQHLLSSIETEMKNHFETVTSKLCIGSASHEILKEAERVGADMIFLGSHGYAKLERLLLGSVAHGVSAHAKATVEIVR